MESRLEKIFSMGINSMSLAVWLGEDRKCSAAINPHIYFFFGESVDQIHILFKLLRDSPIDQIVQTVFGYSLRKEWRQENHKHEHYLKYTGIYSE